MEIVYVFKLLLSAWQIWNIILFLLEIMNF